MLELNMADSIIPWDPVGFLVIFACLLPIVAVPIVRVQRPDVNLPFLPLRHAIIAGWANRLWFDRIYNSAAVYFHASVLGRWASTLPPSQPSLSSLSPFLSLPLSLSLS